MFLHENPELFRDIIEAASASQNNRPISIIEKDYYVTMILKLLSEEAPGCVFKGGTSLSKCHHAIDRFSEDIDITFSDTLTQGQRKNLKNKTIAGISQRLHLPITDWENTRSRRDYNCYTFAYTPIEGFIQKSLVPGVKMEVSLGSISFPTIQLPVSNYIYEFLSGENKNIADEYGLNPFIMTLQSLERTFADKVFAICDYFLEGNIKRHSRHIYDLYMLYPRITLNYEYKALVKKIRTLRAKMSICPSAQPEIDINSILAKIIHDDVYRNDYEEITSYFQNYPLAYTDVIEVLEKIIHSGVFSTFGN